MKIIEEQRYAVAGGQSITAEFRNQHLLVALGLGALSLTLYLSTMVRVHEGDALMYAYAVRQAPIQGLFHPNHLLYNVILRGNFTLWQFVGWHGDTLLPSQFFNALTGAVGVALFSWILFGFIKNPWFVGASAAGLAMSFSYWYHSVELAVHILPVLFVLLAFAIAVRYMERPTFVVAALLGIFTGLSVLFLQSNIFFILVAGTAILITNTDKLRQLGHGMLFLSMAGIPISIGYLVLPCIFLDLCGVRPVLHWTMGYARLPGYGFSSNTWYYAALGWGRTIFGAVAVPKSVGDNIVRVLGRGQYALQLIPFTLALGLVVLVILTIRGFWKTHGKITVVLLVWLISFGIFAVWWEPDNVKYWIPTLPPLLLLVGLACQQFWLRIRSNSVTRHLFQITIVATLVLLGGTSYFGAIRPLLDSSRDLNRKLTEDLNPYVTKSDLVLVPKNHYAFPAYLKFYTGKEATTLHYLAEKLLVNPNLNNTSSHESYIDVEYSNVLGRAGRVYVVNNGFEIPGWTADRQLVSREEAARIMSRYSLQQIIQFSDGNILYELKRSSNSQGE